MRPYKITYYLILLQIITVSILQAQTAKKCNFTIEGHVYDQTTKEPLAFVNIQIKDTGLGTVSDEEGHFIIPDLCEKEYDLVFSRLSYKIHEHHHDFHHPNMEIYMVPEHLMLEGVTIEGRQNQSDLESGSITEISSETLKAIETETLGEVVSNVSGVNMLSTGQNVSKPIIHGLHSNRVLIMNNGVRHEFQNWGADHAPEIDPSLAGNIQVIKGASTVRFGPEALGGVILINPPKMELSTPFSGELKGTGKSNGRSAEGSIELKKGFNWLSLLGGASFVKQGDLRAPDYQLTNTGKEERSYYGAFRLHPIPEVDLEGYYSHFDQNLGVLSGSVFGNLDDLQRAIESNTPFFTKPFSYRIGQPRQDIQHDLYKAMAKYIGEQQSVTVQYAHQINKRREFGVRRGEAPNIDLELTTQTLDVDWRHPTLGPLTGKLGFQYTIQANDNLPGTNTVPFVPNYDLKRYGVYLIESYEFGKSILELGARYDYLDAFITGREPDNTIYRNKIFYRNFSGTVGLKTEIDKYTTFRTNFGTAWRPPNVAELYRFGQHAFFIEYGLWRYTIDERFDFVTTSTGILDEDDRPVPSVVGFNWINTYTVDRPRFRGELTGYINFVEHYIYAKPGGLTSTTRGVFVYFLYDQTDALFWGLDLTGEFTHSTRLASTLKGSYLWSKQVENNDFFVGQPPAKLSYDFTFKPNINFLDQSALKISTSYTFEQFQHPRIITIEEFLFAKQNDIDRFANDASDFDIIPPPKGYFLAHLSWAATLHSFDFHVQVKNIFNENYRNYTDRLRYFADDLGRNFILSVTNRF